MGRIGTGLPHPGQRSSSLTGGLGRGRDVESGADLCAQLCALVVTAAAVFVLVGQRPHPVDDRPLRLDEDLLATRHRLGTLSAGP